MEPSGLAPYLGEPGHGQVQPHGQQQPYGQPPYGQPAYGQPYPPQPPHVQQNVYYGGPVYAVQSKSVALAGVLGFLFGPLGMLYATIPGALIMFAVNIVVAIFTLGMGLFLTWPICAIIAAVAADNHNKAHVPPGPHWG